MANDNHEKIDTIKRELREQQIPYFDEDDFEYYLNKNNGDTKATIYEMLLLKAEDSSIQVSGLSTADTSSYFRRLASKYRQYNTGNLE